MKFFNVTFILYSIIILFLYITKANANYNVYLHSSSKDVYFTVHTQFNWTPGIKSDMIRDVGAAQRTPVIAMRHNEDIFRFYVQDTGDWSLIIYQTDSDEYANPREFCRLNLGWVLFSNPSIKITADDSYIKFRGPRLGHEDNDFDPFNTCYYYWKK